MDYELSPGTLVNYEDLLANSNQPSLQKYTIIILLQSQCSLIDGKCATIFKELLNDINVINFNLIILIILYSQVYIVLVFILAAIFPVCLKCAIFL